MGAMCIVWWICARSQTDFNQSINQSINQQDPLVYQLTKCVRIWLYGGTVSRVTRTLCNLPLIRHSMHQHQMACGHKNTLGSICTVVLTQQAALHYWALSDINICCDHSHHWPSPAPPESSIQSNPRLRIMIIVACFIAVIEESTAVVTQTRKDFGSARRLSYYSV